MALVTLVALTWPAAAVPEGEDSLRERQRQQGEQRQQPREQRQREKQQQEPPEREVVGTTFRTSAELVALNVTVTDSRSRNITGLVKEDFTVYEDGVPQEISFFAASSVPLDLIIMIDTSSSMGDKLQLVQEAAAGFVRTLRPGDRAQVVGFADRTVILQDFIDERKALEDAVRRTVAKGNTSLYNALYVVLQGMTKRVSQSPEIRRQAIVALTDGDDTSSLLSFDDVLEIVKRTGVAVYPISLISKLEARQIRDFGINSRPLSESTYALRTIARESGARAFFPLELRELAGVYDEIATELATQYSLGYAPRNLAEDGAFRRIMVRLVNHPGVQTRTRSGYYSSSQASARIRK